MEAQGHDEGVAARAAALAQRATGLLPDRVAQKITDVAAVDRLDALHTAVKAVRRGGTVSVSGVYGGEIDPMPMMEMFDRGIQLRMGQAHVKWWVDDLMPMVADSADPLGCEASPPSTCRSKRRRGDMRCSGTRPMAASKSSCSPGTERP